MKYNCLTTVNLLPHPESMHDEIKFILYQWIKQSPIQIKNRKSGSDPQKGLTIKFKEITKFEYITIPVSEFESFLLIMNL